MKNSETYVYTNGYQQDYREGGPILATYVNTSRHLKYAKVASSGIVKGNHHDPNSWSYTINRTTNWVGRFETKYPPMPWDKLPTYVQAYFSNFAWHDGPGAPPGDRSAVYNLALNRLNERVRGGLDLGVSLAEAGQTARMLKAIANARNYAYSSKFGSGKDLANGWLAFQYGWRPLMSDIFDAANEALNITLETINTIRGSAKRPLEGLGSIKRYICNDTWDVTSQGKGVQACRIVISCTLPGATLDRWTSLNPLSLAWELTPYSFVVDWFYDVGSFLRNAETSLLYDTRFKSGYVSELYAYEGTETADSGQRKNYLGNNPPQYKECRYARSAIKYIEFYRTKLTSYPLPRAPSFRSDLGSQQLLSLAALLSQMIKK